MRFIAAFFLLSVPAYAEAADPLAPLGIEPSVEARLAPAVRPDYAAFGGPDIEESALTGLLIAAILGEDGVPRERFVMAETFDDAPIDLDAELARLEAEGM